jgi:tryptophan synthase beta chain
VLNHVLLHQTVIGLEAQKQMEMAGEYPDLVIGCVGGGSSFAGLAFPFVHDKLTGKHPHVRLLGAEPESCPTLTRGEYTYDFGDTVGLTPLVKMYTLGHTFVPPGIHAGGLRYHGDAPALCQLVHDGVIDAAAYHQNACFEAAVQFARTEGIIPAPEASHAIRAAIDAARQAQESGEKRVILFNLSGHGHFDMAAYDAYFAGQLEDYAYPREKVEEALKHLPKVAV